MEGVLLLTNIDHTSVRMIFDDIWSKSSYQSESGLVHECMYIQPGDNKVLTLTAPS